MPPQPPPIAFTKKPRLRIQPRPPRPPGTLTFDHQIVEAFLTAFGDSDAPLPETVRCLDEIVTDYIIETCHEAAASAHHARRSKIKLDDFKFMLRRDTAKLGRVSEMLETDKELKRKRKAFDTDEGAVVKDSVEEGAARKDGGEKEGGKKGKDDGDKEREKKKRKKGKKDDDAAAA
ncbi:TFIID-18kDa-domain-containing protein [Lojkania enalia]|uniref:Transcription initiation factor TFIID subunit 13 n=1 Tax=Lojkania enalia TaxID=147567 RepID=A0A9P4K2H1_9PLEO|nr:TFIID-18kDa-domain-containing protein [Didymosphaeria enalia]